MKFSILTLGCDKNTVDSERIAGMLAAHGATIAPEPEAADVVLVNTCAFIDPAKEESIDTILEAARFKDTGSVRALVAVGCLVERHRQELERALPEVDLFFGLRDLDRLVPELTARGLLDDRVRDHPGARLPVGGLRHVSYLKVSEGCDHKCAFCAIPIWRGKHRSFPIDALVAEARALEARGVVELNLVAQDLAHFGRDLPDRPGLQQLLEPVLEATDIPWLRLLYIYSAGLRAELVELIGRESRILPYIDMPIQHASDRMLERMRRPERSGRLREKIDWLRSAIPDLTLRTTVVVGFPGESESDFDELVAFVEDVGFDHLGAFAYSPQAGTPGATMPDPVPEHVKSERLEVLNDVQRSVVAGRNRELIGRELEAIVDRVGARTNGAGGEAVGRIRGQALEIDGTTYLGAGHREPELRAGDLIRVEVTQADDADLWARPVGRVRAAPRPEPGPAPVTLDLRSAWGR